MFVQEQEMEKQKLLFEQSRLSDRGAAEMVLMYISASKGKHHSDAFCLVPGSIWLSDQ